MRTKDVDCGRYVASLSALSIIDEDYLIGAVKFPLYEISDTYSGNLID